VPGDGWRLPGTREGRGNKFAECPLDVVTSHPSLERLDHRPWALPSAPWKWRQRWHDLLFMHWRVPTTALRPLIPPALSIDRFDGDAWVGLVPFRMTGVTLRGMPAVPWLSAFTEMNLRTYVTDGAKPGVWFLRMDASRALAVWAARATLGLPYVWSRMNTEQQDARVVYRSMRGDAHFLASYRPHGPTFEATAETLDAWLTERYCLYSVHAGQLWRVEIHHKPWRLQRATCDVHANTIPESVGLAPATAPPLLHFSALQEVVGWGAETVTSARRPLASPS
jgi:uncharacterized protein